MDIFVHAIRLPRQGREWRMISQIYYGSASFHSKLDGYEYIV